MLEETVTRRRLETSRAKGLTWGCSGRGEGIWAVKCNFKLSGCRRCRTVWILFPPAEAQTGCRGVRGRARARVRPLGKHVRGSLHFPYRPRKDSVINISAFQPPLGFHEWSAYLL